MARGGDQAAQGGARETEPEDTKTSQRLWEKHMRWSSWWGRAGPPPPEEMRRLRAAVQGTCEALEKQRAKERGAAYRQWVDEVWDDQGINITCARERGSRA